MDQSEQLMSKKNETGFLKLMALENYYRIKGMLYFGSDLSTGNYNGDLDLDFGYCV